MDLFTLGEYAIKVALEVGQKIKTLNTTEVDSGITEAYQCALSDWSQHAPTSSDELRLNAALDAYIKNATSYEALDKDTKDFIDCFKKRLSEEPAAHNYLMMLRADEQSQNEALNLQEHLKTQESILDLKGRMEELNMAPQYVRALLKELPLEQGLERTESTLEEMLTNGRIHSEGAKCLIAEFVRFLFERTDKITEEAMQLRESGDSYLAETLEEIKKVLTGESEQSLTAIYEKFKEQERQNEVKALEELIEAAQIQFSFGEAREFYERLIKLTPTTEHYFKYAHLLQSLNDFNRAKRLYDKSLRGLRELSKQKPDTCKADLAKVLNNLGVLLGDTNEFKQAKANYEEALEIFRELSEKNPVEYEPEVAKTLNNLGVLLCYTNDLKQAQTYYKEALNFYQKLAKKDPETHQPYVAATLNNLGVLLSELKDLTQALIYHEQALDIRKELMERNPDAHKPYVARTLNNLGILLSNRGDFKQAKTRFEEALQIRRELADKSPEAYKPDLAKVLNNLGNLFRRSNDLKQAQIHLEEALLIRQELAELNPKTYKPKVAMTLNNLAFLYLELGQKENAKKAYRGAVNLFQELANHHPNAYEIDYARILVTGVIMLGRPLENLEEAKTILGKYPEHPKAQEQLSIIEKLAEG